MNTVCVSPIMRKYGNSSSYENVVILGNWKDPVWQNANFHDHNGEYIYGFDNKKNVKRRFQIIRTERNQKEAERALAEIHALRIIHEAGGLSAMLASAEVYEEQAI